MIPASKKRVFKNQMAYENAIKSLRSKICSISLPNSNANSSEPIPPPPCSSREDNFNLWNEFDLDFTETVQPDNNVVAGIRELDKYLNEEYVSRQTDPLEWWKERKNLYPRVYSYVLKRLCIMATSVPCERIFSATGQIINERRTLLKPEKVSSLVFLHSNM